MMKEMVVNDEGILVKDGETGSMLVNDEGMLVKDGETGSRLVLE